MRRTFYHRGRAEFRQVKTGILNVGFEVTDTSGLLLAYFVLPEVSGITEEKEGVAVYLSDPRYGPWVRLFPAADVAAVWASLKLADPGGKYLVPFAPGVFFRPSQAAVRSKKLLWIKAFGGYVLPLDVNSRSISHQP